MDWDAQAAPDASLEWVGAPWLVAAVPWAGGAQHWMSGGVSTVRGIAVMAPLGASRTFFSSSMPATG